MVLFEMYQGRQVIMMTASEKRSWHLEYREGSGNSGIYCHFRKIGGGIRGRGFQTLLPKHLENSRENRSPLGNEGLETPENTASLTYEPPETKSPVSPEDPPGGRRTIWGGARLPGHSCTERLRG